MKKYLLEFMREFSYPQEAQDALLLAFEKTFAQAGYASRLEEIRAIYEENPSWDFSYPMELAKKVAEETGVHVYTMHLLTLILLSKTSRIHYERRNLSAFWRKNFVDLRYKLEECKLVKGVYGVFCPEWYFGFFEVSRYAIGKLQFECNPFRHVYEGGGVSLTEQSNVIYIHIPRTGEKLLPQDVDEACAKASELFQTMYSMDAIVFVCSSWLLYPENKNLLSPTSNLYSFIDRFELIDSSDDFKYVDAWRLFDQDYTGDADLLPQNTSLRRAYAQRMKKGEPLGRGYGVWVYKAK